MTGSVGTPPELFRAAEPQTLVELRPPRADVDMAASMHLWIDMNHAVRGLARSGRTVLVTDGAVGLAEEENLAHMEANVSDELAPDRLLPFLTCKHPLEYCLVYAERAWAQGIRALTVVGGDPGGQPRCVPHAHELRALIAERVPGLKLGGWVNPHRPHGQQADFLEAAAEQTDYFLSQIVSEESTSRAGDFLEALDRRGLDIPGAFGVFHYRSAEAETLHRLAPFFPVPHDVLARAFAAGRTPEEITAASLRGLRAAGARHLYVSNLPLRNPARTLDRILELE